MCLGNLSTIIYWRINIRLTPLKKMTEKCAHKTLLIMVKVCVLVCALSVSDMLGLLCKTMGLGA